MNSSRTDLDPNTPILVGVGMVQQKIKNPRQAREPIELMIEAVVQSGQNSGNSELLNQIEDVLVPVGRWRYRNPGKLIAEKIGAGNARSVSALPGISQQTILSEACSSIASGEKNVVLVVGGEAGYRILQAGIRGVELEDTVSTELADVVMKPHEEMLPDYEVNSGLGRMPVGYYAIIDSAFRYARGQSINKKTACWPSLTPSCTTVHGTLIRHRLCCSVRWVRL